MKTKIEKSRLLKNEIKKKTQSTISNSLHNCSRFVVFCFASFFSQINHFFAAAKIYNNLLIDLLLKQISKFVLLCSLNGRSHKNRHRQH